LFPKTFITSIEITRPQDDHHPQMVGALDIV
jgi:hypothetical protein